MLLIIGRLLTGSSGNTRSLAATARAVANKPGPNPPIPAEINTAGMSDK